MCEQAVHRTSQQFESAGGESVDVRHLLRAVISFASLSVLVVSDSSWTWTIAAAQAGIGSITCFALSPIAKENFTWLRRGKLSLLDSVVLWESTELLPLSFDLLLTEFFCPEYFEDIPWTVAERCAAVGPAKLMRSMEKAVKKVWRQKIVHCKLGGLTTGSATIMWSGGNGHLVRLREGVYPKRPMTKFVEIAADLP
jgi:hypothetical protein